MIAPRIIGFRCCHSLFALGDRDEVGAEEHARTPSMSNSRAASGEASASPLSRKSAVPSASTDLPGMNFSVGGLGVASVWMNMVASSAVVARHGAGGQDL